MDLEPAGDGVCGRVEQDLDVVQQQRHGIGRGCRAGSAAGDLPGERHGLQRAIRPGERGQARGQCCPQGQRSDSMSLAERTQQCRLAAAAGADEQRQLVATVPGLVHESIESVEHVVARCFAFRCGGTPSKDDPLVGILPPSVAVRADSAHALPGSGGSPSR